MRRVDGSLANSRLTGGLAVVLLLLLALEGATIPFIGQLLGPHMFIGVALIGPVALKLASTGYRLARYYTGAAAYRRKGPPALALRLLGPLVVLSTVALLGTGVALLLAGPPSETLIAFHKAVFFAWFAAMTVHVLGHARELPALALPDWRRHGGREAALAGSGLRIALLVTAAAAGLALAIATVHAGSPWLSAQLGE